MKYVMYKIIEELENYLKLNDVVEIIRSENNFHICSCSTGSFIIAVQKEIFVKHFQPLSDLKAEIASILGLNPRVPDSVLLMQVKEMLKDHKTIRSMKKLLAM